MTNGQATICACIAWQTNALYHDWLQNINYDDILEGYGCISSSYSSLNILEYCSLISLFFGLYLFNPS